MSNINTQIAVIDERTQQIQGKIKDSLDDISLTLNKLNHNIEGLNNTMYKGKSSVLFRLEGFDKNQEQLNKLFEKNLTVINKLDQKLEKFEEKIDVQILKLQSDIDNLRQQFNKIDVKVQKESQKKNILILVLILGWISLIIDLSMNTGFFKMLYKVILE